MSKVQTKKPAPDTGLPPFYREPVVLQHSEHANAGLTRKADMSFAANITAVPIYAGEFAAAALDYPIVFSVSEPAVPLAVVGIKEGHNLLIDQAGLWREGFYVPAYVRRYPFIAANVSQTNGQLLAVDRSCARFVSDVGDADADRFFEADGSPTPFAQSAMQLCHAIIEDQKRTEAFTTALAERKLLTLKHANFQFPDQTQYALDGFRLIDGSVYRQLDASVVGQWHREGWLDLAVLQQASQNNWATLLRLNTEVSSSRKSMQ